MESVRKALHKMKKGNTSRTSCFVLELVLASGNAGIDWMTNLFNRIIAQNKVPGDWDSSVIVNCFKNKGDTTE